jgi:hypothetical protein
VCSACKKKNINAKRFDISFENKGAVVINEYIKIKDPHNIIITSWTFT